MREILNHFRYILIPPAWLGEDFTETAIKAFTIIKESETSLSLYEAGYQRKLDTEFMNRLKKEKVAELKGRKIKIHDIEMFVSAIIEDSKTIVFDPQRVKSIGSSDLAETILELHKEQSKNGFRRLP